MRQYLKGFTMIEIIVAITIIGILTTIVVVNSSAYRNSKLVETTANEIAFKLEEAKAQSIAGKNGSNFGVYFASTSYTFFRGSTYNSSDANNISPSFPIGLSISTSLTSGSNQIVFSRLNGEPSATGNITISSMNNSSTSKTINIGTMGDISVVE